MKKNVPTLEIKMSRMNKAIKLIGENACMINSIFGKEELKSFDGDFAAYLITQLRLRKKEVAKISIH